jgi:nucleoside-diphosphate-sugar epimerase
MRVLLTGASGFIGTCLARHLVAAGHKVIGVDLRRGQATSLLADLRDPKSVQSVAATVGSTDVVAHFAAIAGVRRSLLEPKAYAETNVIGTLHALQLAERLGAGRVVLASSSSVYGRVEGPTSEDQLLAPLSPYAASKVAAEELCGSFVATGAFEAVVVRPFTVYGPGQRPDMFCHQALHKVALGEKIDVWEWQRDFTFIDEVCLAASNAIIVPTDSPVTTYNLGSGRPVSVFEFVATLEKVTRRRVRVALGTAPPCEPALTFADATRARAELGLSQPIGFADGLAAQHLALS